MSFSSDDESLQLELATALSLAEIQENQVFNKEVSDSDESELQEAFGHYYDDREEDFQLALAISETQEEEDMKKAIALSETTLKEDDDFRSLLLAQQLVLYEPSGNQSDLMHRALPLVELQEQLLEWSENTPEDVGLRHHLLPSNDRDTTDDLPTKYKNYRLEPTLFSDDEMWPPNAVSQQLRELRVSRGMEEIREWSESQSESDRCLVCLTNVATRVAVPCGHKLCCRLCLPSLTEKASFYSVTSPDGEVQSTDRRLPVQCFTCRAIIGQIVTLH